MKKYLLLLSIVLLSCISFCGCGPVVIAGGIAVAVAGGGGGGSGSSEPSTQSSSTSTSTTTTTTIPNTAPTIPTGLTATAVSTSQINLLWNASTDDVGVTGYSI